MIMPKEFVLLSCVCERAQAPVLLCYTKARGFFEPITNTDAAPVVGRVLTWSYVRG